MGDHPAQILGHGAFRITDDGFDQSKNRLCNFRTVRQGQHGVGDEAGGRGQPGDLFPSLGRLVQIQWCDMWHDTP